MGGIFRYALVGAVCQVINSGGFALMHYALHWHALLCQGLAFFASTLTDYFLSRRFVFGARHKARVGEAFQFIILGGAALVLAVLWLHLMTGVLRLDTRLAGLAARVMGDHAPPEAFWVMVPQMLTGPVVLIAQYIGGKVWIFRKGGRG